MEGNQQKMREALLKLRAEIGRFYNNEWIPYDDWEGCEDVISHALSAPARQCDVGTAEEQTTRYRKFCAAHKYLGSDFSYMCKGFGKGRCPFSSSHTKSQCEFAWAQTPYAEEGGAE